MKRILVAGGGIAGLTAAYHLQRSGHDVSLWEAGANAGGPIRSCRQDGYLFEAGPTSFLGSAENLWALSEQLGLGDSLLASRPTAKKRYIFRDGRLCALPGGPLSAITSPALSLGAKLRALGEPWRPRGGEPAESVYDFVARRFGEEAACYLVEPFVGGVYAGDAHQLCAAAVFPKLVHLEQEYGSVLRGLVRERKRGGAPRRRGVYSFRDGLVTLPRALSARLGSAVHLGRSLTRLEQGRDGRWRVEGQGQGSLQLEGYDEVVLALPAHASAALLGEWAAELAALLAGIPYAPVAVVGLGLSRDQIAHPLDGFGCLVPRNQGRLVLGCVWASSLFEGRAPAGKVCLEVYLGGACSPSVMQYDDEGMQALVLRELADILGLRGQPEVVRIFRHPRAIPQYVLAHNERIEQVKRLLLNYPGLHLAGNYLQGVSMNDAIGQAVRVAADIAPTAPAAAARLATAVQ